MIFVFLLETTLRRVRNHFELSHKAREFNQRKDFFSLLKFIFDVRELRKREGLDVF